MAKRVSLKDKGAETLGLTSKKGRGMDALFGESGQTPAAAATASDTTTQPAKKETSMDTTNDLSGLLAQTPAQPAPMPVAAMPALESLPVNEADDGGISEHVVDELGLPVAMDAPPPDLHLATPVAEAAFPPAAPAPLAAPFMAMVTPLATPIPAAAPPNPPTMPAAVPVALPSPPMMPVAPVTPPSPPVMPVAPVTPPSPPVMTAPVTSVDTGDLSGMADENDLSGLAATTPAPAIIPPAPVATTPVPAAIPPVPATIPPANLPPSPPPVTAGPSPYAPYVTPPISTYIPPAPVPYTPSVVESTYRPPVPAISAVAGGSVTYTAQPSALSLPTGAPSLSMPRSKIETVGGFVTDKVEIKNQDIAPEDTKQQDEGDYILKVDKLTKLTRDDEMERRVGRFVSPERREKLATEIEQLYDDVATQLNKPDEIMAAFRILHEAQGINYEDNRQYDEALYRVATVKAMLAHKKHLSQWSYTWGLFVFFYALVWLVAFIAGLLFRDQLGAALGKSSEMVNVIKSGWFSAAAGGIGGVSGILYSLYWRVSHKRDFDPQYIMYYLTQPILGFILGAVLYFIIAAGFLVVGQGSFVKQDVQDLTIVVALYILLGWLAGFRQRVVMEMVEKIVRRLMGLSNEAVGNTTAPAQTDVTLQPATGDKK